jgi:hypothetical protein
VIVEVAQEVDQSLYHKGLRTRSVR